ncbi:potassium transporter domain containing protein [Naviculisporaceae sp. PSN 640]
MEHIDGAPLATPTIKIEEPVYPVRCESSGGDGALSTGVSLGPGRSALAGGIYHTRSRARSLLRGSMDRRSGNRTSHDLMTYVTHDVEEGEEWRDGDQKRKQIFKGKMLMWLAYQSVGVIYGDIGTSPLYVYSSTFTSPPNYEDLFQVLSVIIWSLTIVVTLKYVLIFSMPTMKANITDRDPREQVTVRLERHLSQDLGPTNRTVRAGIEKSKFTRGLLKTIGVLAVSMVMADGVLTPAQSVLGAVQGLKVVRSDISSPTVVGTTCGILILLFAIQPFGTTKLASSFAPIVILWLSFNFGFGVYNLVHFDWAVLKAFSPYFAFQFFTQHQAHAWRMLGGILLAFTGVEALFADLGAFSLRAIQLSWSLFVYPCLLLAYIGQAAYISVRPDAYDNPFFNSVPPGMLYPSLVVAVLAAIVASQAIITATFQLVSQIMKLSYCPQVKVVHTSRTFHGQLYVPFLNWLLMIGAVLVTAVYSDTTRLGNAYGVCVMFVTFFDTCMVTLIALIVWKFSPFLVFISWLVFASVDGLYLSSALTKVPDGAWFTLTLSGILACLFLLWRFGKENQWRAEAEDRFKPTDLVRKDEEGLLKLTDKWGGDPLSAIRGFGVFFDKTGVLTPSVFTHFVSKFVSVPDVAVFFHLHPVEKPSVEPEERYKVSHFTAVPGCYRLVVRHGFMDEVISPDLGALVYAEVRRFIIRQACDRLGVDGTAQEKEVGDDTEMEEQEETAGADGVTDSGQSGETNSADAGGSTSDSKDRKSTAKPGEREREKQPEPVPVPRVTFAPRAPLPVELRDDRVAAEVARLDRAYAAKVMYIVGKEQMRVSRGSSLFRRGILSVFLWIRDNTRAKIANLRLAMDRVVEIGFVKEI